MQQSKKTRSYIYAISLLNFAREVSIVERKMEEFPGKFD